MKKYKIGYVQGTFDMFHIGHLNILKRAKEVCDYLIVGVNTDGLVLEYKRKKTIIPFEERLEIVSQIKYVDKAVGVKDRDKFKALEDYRYDVLLMGDDWKGTDFYNDIEKKLKEVGVDIVYFPYTESTSSTIIKEKLMNY